MEPFSGFHFNNGLLQDVAYGTSVLKYTDREKQVVSHVTLPAQFKHVITYYQKFCDESFEPLYEHTFYKILNGLIHYNKKALLGWMIWLQII